MSSAVKIAVIGAGSAQFSAGLINDLCRTESLADSHVTLMDVNPERLALVHQLGERYADELGVRYTFETTTDRAVALQDADFAVNTVINKKGIQPLHVGTLPRKIMLEHILPEWLDMERRLEAFKTGDRSMLLWSILDSHQTRSYDQAVTVLEDLMAMDGHGELAQYTRYPPNW